MRDGVWRLDGEKSGGYRELECQWRWWNEASEARIET
jgi:hypothetical protein